MAASHDEPRSGTRAVQDASCTASMPGILTTGYVESGECI
eukprot:CAMPEP_0185156132 /NCGR_PEP_ID=MMETSP1139-20130426/890_1 /TAXON_ID=298111 /ORGANISM="Pavlova sp., Strain CCMP459" /LENGTH=39 /DNA_ID= /DNA_START= /DNA_END= /DNA_ORIENTATION=